MANRKPNTTNAAAKRKTKTPRVEKDEEFDRFGVLLEEAQKFCEGVGLHKDLINEILRTDSDWAFILKVDALLESAAKQILRGRFEAQAVEQNPAQRDFGRLR